MKASCCFASAYVSVRFRRAVLANGVVRAHLSQGAAYRSITSTSSANSRRRIMSTEATTDYTSWTNSDLIVRVSELERQLRHQNAQFVARATSPKRQSPPTPRRAKAFDANKYSTRHIALKIAYLGQKYNGFEHANGNVTPLPTIEEMLWKALRKTRLISPVTDEPVQVAWSHTERKHKPLHINWEGCQYSKCGRTDRGVSAFGQVIGIRVRSNKPIEKSATQSPTGDESSNTAAGDSVGSSELPGINVDELSRDVKASFDPIKDELPYISILNAILPSDIRVLAWCPHPPDNFDARFSCGERRYRYFFTNPAFLPTPGPVGLKDASGCDVGIREGWLDIDAMKEAAKKLIGRHDYRNFCSIDASKQLTTFERTITHADIEEVREQSGPTAFFEHQQLAKLPHSEQLLNNTAAAATSGPKVYSFNVHGSAFLWHQVRHMVAVLFLIGQRLESPSIVDELLDIERNPCRPTYEMASDAPLVLWDCTFPKDTLNSPQDDELDWLYAGDARTIPGLTTKGDGKFLLGGVVDEVWSNWRKHKIGETLSSTLLDLVVSQGDGSALERGGFRDLATVTNRSQKLFDGSESARMAGKYVHVMQKPPMDPVEVQNAKYRAGKGSRRQMREAQQVNSEDRSA
jgi:tRNA pseudouridine38/39 synthase